MSFFSWLKDAFAPKPPRFATQVQEQLAMLGEDERQKWAALLKHCDQPTQANPTGKWAKEAKDLFDAVGAKAFVDALLAWFSPVGREEFERSGDLVKGLVWCTVFADDERLSATLGDLGEAAFRRVANKGPVSPKVGNACVYALGASASLHATAQLSRLKAATHYRSAQKMIDKAVTSAAEERGVSKDALEELSAPSFEGSLPQKLGRWSPQLHFADGRLDVRWVRDDGKTAAGVPAEVKREHPQAAAELKDQLKRMEKLLPGHVERLERLFTSDRALPLRQWHEHYVEHGLVGFLARPLVWRFGQRPGLWFDGAVIDANGARLELDDSTEVRLWHPLGRGEAERVAFQALLAKLGAEQPFEQLSRKVFTLTEVEASSGILRRWLDRRLNQHTLAQLCRKRGWQFAPMARWNPQNTLVRALPEWQLEAQLDVTPIDEREATRAGVYFWVTAGVLMLRRRGSPLAEVPPVVLSELLRDVDAFVAGAEGPISPQRTS